MRWLGRLCSWASFLLVWSLAAVLSATAQPSDPDSPPSEALTVRARSDGSLTVEVRATGPGFLDLQVTPEAGAASPYSDRWLLAAGSRQVTVAPPDPGVYTYEARWRGLAFDPPEPLNPRGRGPGRVRSPGYLALAPWGDLLVADRANRRVQVLSPEGRFRLSLGSRNFRGAGLGEPAGLTTSEGDTVLVADRLQGRLHRWNRDGRPVEGVTPDPPLRRAGGLAGLKGGSVLVTQPDRDQVLQLTADGRVRHRFGGFGSARARLRRPTDVEVVARHRFWVVEERGARLQLFDLGGASLATLKGSLVRPHGLTVDADGLIYVADRSTRSIHVFSREQGEIMVLGGRVGDRPVLGEPWDVAFLPGGDLVVSDPGRDILWRLRAAPRVILRRGQLQLDPVR